MKKEVYLDFASTTPVDKKVVKAMAPFWSENFGNPSSIHFLGLKAKKAIDEARKSVRLLLQVHNDEIVFTSGGTESNNLAILGVIKYFQKKGLDLTKSHFVTTRIEHSSVLECFKYLEGLGARVDYIPVLESGLVDLEQFKKALNKDTVFVSIGYANNEIGVVQDIREFSRIAKSVSEKIIFHSDASQAPLYLNCLPENLGVDLLTFDGHKMYGPKGVGVLYVRRGTNISPIFLGGGQEFGLRSTTENLALIAGFSHAFKIAHDLRDKESKRLVALRDYFIAKLLALDEKRIFLNGDPKKRLPNNVNVSILGIDPEFTVLKLDAVGIYCSTKSSCLKDEKESYVVKSATGNSERASTTLRFTMGRETSKKDLDFVISHLKKVI